MTLSAAALSALQRGNKIDAIKLVRQEHGLELKDAKDRVDQYLRTHPNAYAAYAEAQRQSGNKALWWLIVVIAGAVLAYLLTNKR